MKRLFLSLFIVGLILCVAVPSDGSSSFSSDPSTVESAIPDWTLSIPAIDFHQTMTEIHKQGSDLPVPDSNPGYYTRTDGNLFIVGHNISVFGRLKKLPSEIFIYHNDTPERYTLTNSQDLPIDQIDMNSLLTYPGVVMMTCSGDYQNGAWNKRLILFYNK